MTITLDISPEIEAELARQAAMHGLGIGAYAANLLEKRPIFPPCQSSPAHWQRRRTGLSCSRRCGASTSILSARGTPAGISTCEGIFG